MTGREEILAGKLFVDSRDKLIEMLEIFDRLQTDNSVADPPNDWDLNLAESVVRGREPGVCRTSVLN